MASSQAFRSCAGSAVEVELVYGSCSMMTLSPECWF